MKMSESGDEHKFDVENDYSNEQDETFGESPIQQTPTRSGISKERLPKKLIIPDGIFDQASNLRVGMEFENWNHANLVLLAYGKQIGFVWRIQDKYLDKDGGVYKYVFECRHAGVFKLKKKTATDPWHGVRIRVRVRIRD